MRIPTASAILLSPIIWCGCSGEQTVVEGQVTPIETVADADADRASTSPSDWPNWRGAHHDGIARDNQWSPSWGDDGPTRLWHREIGIGFSSMAVVDGRVFALGHDGRKSGGQETVWCLAADTGEILWQRSYAGPLVNNLHEGGPGATPTVDGDYVYTVGRGGQLHCLTTAEGKTVWSKDLTEDLGVKLPEWGFTCSPLVLGKLLILEAGRTVAYDKRTGERIWRTGKFRAGYGSPVAFDSPDGVLLAVLNNDYLLVMRADNGKEIARTSWETKYATNGNTPIVFGSNIFVSTGYDKGCALFKLDAAGKTLTRVYSNREMRNHFNNSVLLEGHLYGIDGNSHHARSCRLVCMELASGEVRWSERGFGCGSLLIADNKLIILSDDGRLVTADATPEEYREINSAQVLSGRCWTVPVLSGNRIYCRNAAGDLVALDVGDQ